MMEEGEASCVVEIQKGDLGLQAEMQNKISEINKSLSDKPAANGNNSCIFRLPPKFKDIKGLIHKPQVVSIGPYHCGEESGLVDMEELKWQCLAYSVKKSKKDVGQYLESIRELEKNARECYSDKMINDLNSDKFLKMMVLDGCFIIQFLLFSWPSERSEEQGMQCHPLSRMERAIFPKIYSDLLLLENQIPYLVLKQLFKISMKSSADTNDQQISTKSSADTNDQQISTKSSVDTNDQQISTKSSADTNDQDLSIIAVEVFSAILGARYHKHKFHRHKFHRHKSQHAPKYLHLLDLVRSIFIPPGRKDREEFQQENYRRGHLLPDLFRLIFSRQEWPLEYRYRPCDTIPRISKLRRAGIKVNPRKKDSFLVVDFQHGVIEMPTIILNDLMCSFLVNCVAFEQCYNNSSKNFSVYALFLDCLVNTTGDVEYLCEHRVIENYIENQAANFINNLGKGLTFDWDYVEFFVLCRSVNQYYRSSLYRQWTSFKGEYFDKPWLWISGSVALVLLVLTFLQTYYSMKTYYTKPE